MKETSPPLPKNWRKSALSSMPGRKIFHRTPQHLPQGRSFFHSCPSPTPQARQNSPCSPPSAPTREKVRPAHTKHPKIGLFRLLGEPFRADGATATSQHPPTTLPETDDTNAGGSLPRNETTGTSASSFPHTAETTDTFARTKRPFSGHFPPAKVSRVSWTPRRAPAKALPVSRTLINVPTELPPGSQQSCHRDHSRRPLRPQPKPLVACAHATTPVAHWPHD